MAVETGPFVRALDDADLAPLTVSDGADVCQEEICGNWFWVYTELEFGFAGGARTNVGLGASGDLTFSARRYTARNVRGGRLTKTMNPICTDIERTRTWAIWSRPAGP